MKIYFLKFYAIVEIRNHLLSRNTNKNCHVLHYSIIKAQSNTSLSNHLHSDSDAEKDIKAVCVIIQLWSFLFSNITFFLYLFGSLKEESQTYRRDTIYVLLLIIFREYRYLGMFIKNNLK